MKTHKTSLDARALQIGAIALGLYFVGVFAGLSIESLRSSSTDEAAAVAKRAAAERAS